MSKFTKTLIASALAVAVAGPVAADVKMNGTFSGDKTKLDIKPSGRKNANLKNQQTEIGFGQIPDIAFDDGVAFAGCFGVAAFGWGEVDTAVGAYIERKVGKDLTMALTEDSLEDVIYQIWDYLNFSSDASKCGYDDTKNTLWDEATVKKANGKISKNGDRVKLDIQVDTKYTNDKGKDKNVKASIKGNMDFAAGANPMEFCDAVFIQPI